MSTVGCFVLHAYCDAQVSDGDRPPNCGRMEEFKGESYRKAIADGREHGWRFTPGGEFCWCREHAGRSFDQREADRNAAIAKRDGDSTAERLRAIAEHQA